MAPRSSKRKRKGDGADAQDNPPQTDAQAEEPVQAPPSGHPFIQAEDYIITDTQIEQELDALARAEEVTAEQRALVVAMNFRPIRIVYPSKACRSPYLREDIRPGPQKFDAFIEGEDDMRNVGLFFNVYKEFFNKILDKESELSDDHVAHSTDCNVGDDASIPFNLGGM